MLEINNLPIKFNNDFIDVDLLIGNISWNNDGIGCYEYGGLKEVDKGKLYIEEFDVIELRVNGMILEETDIFRKVYDTILKDGKIFKEIKRKLKYDE